MKNIAKKVKGKKVLSIVLAAIMLATTFNIALPMLKLGASAADIEIGGVTQTQIVTDTSAYGDYAAAYLNGASHATDIIIPGLSSDQDYVIQGMTYYPAKDWMLVTAYHNYDSENDAEQFSSKIFALDAVTGEFVAMFDFKNSDGTVNYDHGGGIAVSEHNLYYACGDKDQKIAYAPLSEFDVENGTYKTVTLLDSINLYELGESYTAYVCYDQGVLWAGNFYDAGASILGIGSIAADYNTKVNSTYNSMVFGYKLAGNSSEEEWDYLKGKFANLLEVAVGSGSAASNGSEINWTAYKNAGAVNIAGTITAPTADVGEFTANFGSVVLTEGVNYTIEFTSNYRDTDLYMYSSSGAHCNVKASSQTVVTEEAYGRYHFEMNFTAGLKPEGADSSWPTTQSTDGSYTGTYTLRFDQDNIAAGEAREFEITNIKISQTNTYDNKQERVYDEGSAGSPTYAIGLNNSIKDVQYAVVDNGKLYLSRSYGSGAGNSVNFGFGETSTLTIADIDLSITGTKTTEVSTSDGETKTINVYEINNFNNYPMMPMSEGLCVVNDNIFITFESASNKYLNESSGLTGIGNCEMPIDVVWQLDPYELMEIDIPEPENSIYYEKVNSLSEIENGAEYLIVHKSEEVDPVTQRKVLYALDADGGLKEHKLSKSDSSVIKGYNGMIGHEITEYSIVRAGETDSLGNKVDKDRIYLDNAEKDDVDTVRWALESIDNDRAFKIKTTDSYFANCNCLYFDEDKITMAPSNAAYLSNIKFMESGNGNGGLWLSNADAYFLWSNDGLSENYNEKITSYYIENGANTAIYSGLEEADGTFHTDALNTSGSNIIGGAVETGADSYYADGVFYLYKRVMDETSSTYESRVYTGLNAELQADGTYTVELETYAISPNHYQYVGEKPTDYIIVADTSSSMSNTGSTGIATYSGDLKVNSLSQSDDTASDNGVGVNGYGFSNPDEDIYFLHTDGRYYKIKLAVNTISTSTFNFRQRYWAYYVANDGLYYVLQSSCCCGGSEGGVYAGITQEEFINHVDNSDSLGDDSQYTCYSTNSSNVTAIIGTARQNTVIFNGTHYRFDDTSSAYTDDHTRIDTLKNAASNLVGQIASENSENRIALVQFGGSTGFYNTSSTLSTSDYANAFWSASNASGLQTIISNFTTSDLTTNDGIEFAYVNNIMANTGIDYTGSDKERNVAIIFLSDGVAGADDQSDATTAANANIARALTAKKAGAFVYTVMIGADGTTFNKKLYMDALSSKYAEAESMTDLGGQSVDGVNYTLNLATTTINNFIDFGEVTLKEIAVNNAVALENLDANSILREELSDAFIVPVDDDNFTFTTKYVDGKFDAIGRFSFDEDNAYDATNLNISWDSVNTPELVTISGYDYSTEYIAKGKEGRKLKILITGLLANPEADITNTSINNTATTAIYQDETDLNNGVAFKKLPTVYFNIPEYTYVLDYGLDMLDTDVNGTLKAVSAGLTKQDVDNYTRISENGLVKIADNDLDLIYHTTPTNMTDSGYVLIQRDDESYDWFEIKVVPASNVYFEETEFATTAGTGSVEWSTASNGISVSERKLPGDNDVYGYDAAYNNTNAYSNGTALSASVDSTNKRSKTATVSFAGNGIDIISACGPTTGMQIINIKDASTGSSVAASIVDTYYADATFSQVPVFSWRGAYGNYIVETTAVYLSISGALSKSGVKSSLVDTGIVMNTSDDVNAADVQAMLDAAGVEGVDADNLELVWFDDNSVLNGGSGVSATKTGARSGDGTSVTLVNYIDGFRIYNPLGSDSSDYDANEQGATYINVIDSLVDGTLVDGSLDFTSGTVAFVTGSLADGEELGFANYESVGPENELYLQGNATNGVAFSTPAADGGRVMISLRAVNGATTVNINGNTFDVTSATEMYYDITDMLEIEDDRAVVSIINSGNGILAVNHIKLTSSVAGAQLMLLDEADIQKVQYFASVEPVQAKVENGVVTTVEEEISEDNTNTDVETETEDSGASGIFAFIEMLIAFIEKILGSSIAAGSIF